MGEAIRPAYPLARTWGGAPARRSGVDQDRCPSCGIWGTQGLLCARCEDQRKRIEESAVETARAAQGRAGGEARPVGWERWRSEGGRRRAPPVSNRQTVAGVVILAALIGGGLLIGRGETKDDPKSEQDYLDRSRAEVAKLGAVELHRRLSEFSKRVAIDSPRQRISAKNVITMFGPFDKEDWADAQTLIAGRYVRPDGQLVILFTNGIVSFFNLVDTAEQRAAEAKSREDDRKRKDRERRAEEAEARQEAEQRRTAEEEGLRAAAEATKREKEEAARAAKERRAAVVGHYLAVEDSVRWIAEKLKIDAERVEFAVTLNEDGSAVLRLRVNGRTLGEGSGTWTLDPDHEPRILVLLTTQVARQWQGIPNAGNFKLDFETRQGIAHLRDRSEESRSLWGPNLFGPVLAPLTSEEFTRRGLNSPDAAPTPAAEPDAPVDPAPEPKVLGVADLLGIYVPTKDTLNELEARLGKTVTYRLELKAGLKFTTTYKEGSKSELRTTGTWKLVEGGVELTAHESGGRKLREAKVEVIPIQAGPKLKMEYVVLERK